MGNEKAEWCGPALGHPNIREREALAEVERLRADNERLREQLEIMAAANKQLSKALERAINGYSGA